LHDVFCFPLQATTPGDLPEAMKTLFEVQELKRFQLRMQHIKERVRALNWKHSDLYRVIVRHAHVTCG